MASIGLRIILGCTVVAAAALLSACGGAEEHADQGSSPVTSEAANPHSAADVTFAREMVAHHHQGIDLANLVPERSTDKAVISMANKISSQQLPEVTAMTALLAQWNEDGGSSHDQAGTGDHGGGNKPETAGSSTVPGIVDTSMMIKLKALTGAPFDKLWLQSMISHDEAAITMAKTEIAEGQNTDMVVMAKNIVAVEQTEIDEMKQILGG
jgi:uncharacterized protein (DUF305 family)